MMNQKTHVLVLIASVGFLSACSSVEKSGPSIGPSLAAQPTYQEKAQTTTVAQFSSTHCTSENAWTSRDWRKAVIWANACAKNKDWLRLEKLGNDLAVRAPLTPWGPYYMSLAAVGRQDYPRARWMLELTIKKAPNEGLFHYELARIHWDLKEDAAAIKELKLASDLSPGLTDAHWIMGRIALQRQDFSLAESYLQKALTSNPKHLSAILTMAALKISRKDFNQAEELLQRAAGVNPRSAKARLALAQVQEEHQKKLNDALRTYRQIKQLAHERKLDESIQMNLDDKIRVLEKTLSQATKSTEQLTVRTPSAEENVQP